MSFKRTPFRGNYRHKATCDCIYCYRRNLGIYGNGEGIKKKADNLDYFSYIKSNLWAIRRKQYYLGHKRQCRACGSYKDIELHHMRYGHFGNEKDTDLIPLCGHCHGEFHKLYPIKSRLKTNTLEYVKNKQEAIKRVIHLTSMREKGV